MDWPLIAKALLRHKTVVGLLLFQCMLAVPLFVIGSSVFHDRYQAVTFPSGVDEEHLVYLQPRMGGLQTQNLTQDDIYSLASKLRSMQGVRAVGLSSALPFTGSKTWEPITSISQDVPTGYRLKASVYGLDDRFFDTAGIRVVEGRGFTPEEFVKASPLRAERFGIGLISRSLASKLFFEGHALGKRIFLDGKAITVIGVVADVARPQYTGPADSLDVIMLPTIPFRDEFGRILSVRLDEAQSSNGFMELLKSPIAPSELRQFNFDIRSLKQVRNSYFKLDLLVLWIVAASIILLSVVIGCGIGGLSSFWADQRLGQVVTLRALGATRSQARAMIFKENLLICGAGAILGSAFAYAASLYLYQRFGISTGSLGEYAFSLVLVIMIGQISISRSAWALAKSEPALASRV